MKFVALTQGSPEWLAWRRGGIGSSDIAAICGVCPYRSRIDVMREKLGFGETFVNAAMERGTKYEETARLLLNKETGTCFSPQCVEHDLFPYFIASLDGLSIFCTVISEIKVPGKKTLDKIKMGIIPESHIYQMQWQLYITEADYCWYCVYDFDENKNYTKKVLPNPTLINNIQMQAQKFYDDLQEGRFEDPKNDFVKTEQNYQLKRMHEINQNIKDLEKEYEEIKADFLGIYGGDKSIKGEDFILARTERQGVDYKKAAEENCPDLAKYKKEPSISWSLRKIK